MAEMKPNVGVTALQLNMLAWHRLISYVYPARNEDLLKQLQQKHMTVLGKQL